MTYEQEADLTRRYYAPNGAEKETTQEIGDSVGVARQWVKTIAERFLSENPQFLETAND